MKVIGQSIIVLTGIVSQIPIYSILKDAQFAPPIEGGSIFYLIIVEVVCTASFAVTFYKRDKISYWVKNKLIKLTVVTIILLLILSSSYSLILNNYFVEDRYNSRCMVPINPCCDLKVFIEIKKERHESLDDCSSIESLKSDNKIQYLITYFLVSLNYSLMCAVTIFIFTSLGISMSRNNIVKVQ